MHEIVILSKFVQDSFSISPEVDGSALYYTVTYAESTTGNICGSTIISAFSCKQGACVCSLPSLCYRLSGAITISLSATNSLGDGPANSITIGIVTVVVILYVESVVYIPPF